MKFYLDAVSALTNTEAVSTHAICCPWFALRSASSTPPVTSVEDVEGALAAGGFAIKDDSRAPQEIAAEHWCSLVRLKRLRAFLALASPGLVGSAFCDVAFAQYINAEGMLRLRSEGVRRTPWLYAYNASSSLDTIHNLQLPRGGGHSSGSGGGDAGGSPAAPAHAGSDPFLPTAAELKMASALVAEMRVQFPISPWFHKEANLARKLAMHRRNLHINVATSVWVAAVGARRDGNGRLQGSGTAQAEAEAVAEAAAEAAAKTGADAGAKAAGGVRRARRWAGLIMKHQEHTWEAYARTPQQRALDLYLLARCGDALCDVLHLFGVPEAERVADAFEDDVCRRAQCGVPSQRRSMAIGPAQPAATPATEIAVAAAPAARGMTAGAKSAGLVAGGSQELPMKMAVLAVVMRVGGASSAGASTAGRCLARSSWRMRVRCTAPSIPAR